MSKCCCIHDDIYWRWPTLTTLKPFFKIDCGTQQLQKSIPSKLKMCIWKGLLESKVIWSLVAVSQGQKVNHLFLVNKSMNSNRTSYAMRAWLVWKTQCSCPSYFKSASQGKRLWIQKFHLTTCCHTARKHRLLVQQEDLLEFYQEEVWNIAASGPHRDQKECLYWKKL